jgi:hypothetical protein
VGFIELPAGLGGRTLIRGFSPVLFWRPQRGEPGNFFMVIMLQSAGLGGRT